MIVFGPATITHNGTNLGKTYGGGTLRIISESVNPIGAYNPTPIAYGGEGSVSFYNWNGITVTNSLQAYDFGNVIITLSTATITLPSCKILVFLDEDLSFGTLTQQVIKAKLIFKPSSGTLLTIT